MPKSKPFVVGQSYTTKEGKTVTCLEISGECARFDDPLTEGGGWRYQREGDRGRVTGTPFDRSDPRCIDPEPDVPRVGEYKATEEMEVVYQRHHDHGEGFKLFARLCYLGNEAHDAVVSEGACQNGARMITRNIRDAYFTAAQAFIWTLPDEKGRDYFPWMVLRNRSGGHTMPSWMQHLIDKNHGAIPETWSNSDVMADKDIPK